MDSNGVPHGNQDTTKNYEEQDLEQDFRSSELGTKQYWDGAYQRELRTYKDIGDVGEIWFGEESMNRLIKFLRKENVETDAAILDVGTGNGILLVELAKSGFTNLTGIDYSAAAVELAKNVLEQEGLSNVKVMEVDFLSCPANLTGFDVCMDKGTFDAISLNPDSTVDGKAHYLKALQWALRKGGLFVITSCNWTKEQLLHFFKQEFEFHQELPTPSFMFGGKTGHSVTALVFKRLH
ncbi:hypothetical protein COCON_G00222250 [Conger conger]|uniref:EEF1A lysine methyltransferase 2 n=1 Tax=Conger conger TaxID=82655 RepID=A0A9Q1CWJ2_CONCO|nr:EEF1A lysine methyltransferase 2 [Conger conger]XP_061084437.1 EEF1A lysine methyltransferase 2 [Conger conger]KAJ8250303.1 hypothetical protein COCON_G00222250 [Conger conger]